MRVMRKALSIVSVLLITMTLISANVVAGEIEQNSKGNVRIINEEHWEKTGVTVTPEAKKHTNEWIKAFKNPNTIVPLETRSVTKMIGPFKQRTETFIDSGIIYDAGTATVTIKKDVNIVKTKDMFNPFLIFVLISVFLLALSNFFKAKSNTFAFIAFVAAAVVVFVAVVFVSAAAVAAVAAAAFVALAAAGGNKKIYWFASAAFYTLMAFAVIAMYQ